MKIEHVAIWVKDIDNVCEFYRKYFGGVIQPLYHNPAKQFTSRFITFDDGARLEIMHRPDINVGTLTESKSNILGFGNVHTSVAAALTLRMFHVEQFHLAFSVGSKEKVDRLTQQMSDDGITIVGQPRTTGDGYYESVVLDPEGNRIEITE